MAARTIAHLARRRALGAPARRGRLVAVRATPRLLSRLPGEGLDTVDLDHAESVRTFHLPPLATRGGVRLRFVPCPVRGRVGCLRPCSVLADPALCRARIRSDSPEVVQLRDCLL